MEDKAFQDFKFSLVDLPPELVELIVSYLDSRSLTRAEQCNTQLKGICTTDHYWKKLIEREKSKIIGVSTKINRWKNIFKRAVPYTLEDAISAIRFTTTPPIDLKLIFSPGEFIVPLKDVMTIRSNVHLIGLYDVPYSDAGANQRSIIHCAALTSAAPIYMKEVPLAIVKNITIKLTAKESRQFGALIEKTNVSFINCVIECGIQIRKEAKVTMENCYLYGGPNSGISVMGASVTIDNCRISNNEVGVSLLSIGFDETCSITNSTITHNTRGINASNVQAKFSLKENIIEYNKQYGVGTNSSRASLEKNKICYNHTGVFSCEMSLIALEDNKINKNNYWGVCIQHGSAIGKFTGNILAHNHVIGLPIKGKILLDKRLTLIWALTIVNGIGIQLPESLNRPHLTAEALHAHNTFTDNETDIVRSNERVTDQGFIALAPVAAWAPLDSAEVLETKLKSTIKRKFCTFNMTGTNYVMQGWYNCGTCRLVSNTGICVVCARTCHKGHEVSATPQWTLFFCDCGAGHNCKALWK